MRLVWEKIPLAILSSDPQESFMPVPDTKLYLSSALASGGGYTIVPNAAGDFAPTVTGVSAPAWVTGIADINSDGVADMIIGAPGDDDKTTDAGRVFVTLGHATGGGVETLGDASSVVIIDGVNAGDMAGAAVGTIRDLNGDGRTDYLVGAPGMENGALTDAGAAFVLWGKTSGGIDLGDPATGGGGGYIIKGQAAGDHAGEVVTSITDLNGDGKAEVLVGASGNDAGGADAGAAYVVWGRNSSAAVTLDSVATGTRGFRIVGEGKHDAAGHALTSIADLNGDGKAEILVGASGNEAGGADAGAAYVVFGKSTGTQVNLSNVAAGSGGYRITGQAGEQVGSALASIGDVNGDGKADILIGAPGSDRAYVVFGKSTTGEVHLSDVAAGLGGFAITPGAYGSLQDLSVSAGGDFNRDGIADYIIGTPHDSEGGADAGAVYVVWGGGSGPVDLALVEQGIGGAKIVGSYGSLTGSTVASLGDLNGDGASDLLIGSPGFGESAQVLYAPTSWVPDHNVYGTNGDDVLGVGDGVLNKIGAGDDTVLALDGNDSISTAGGNDSIDGGFGADSMAGGTGNDTYYVDNSGDVIVENASDGTDTVISSVDTVLSAHVENLQLVDGAISGTGNDLDNTLTGNNQANILDGGAGADIMIGGAGNDVYHVDHVGDVVTEVSGGGTDTVVTSVDFTMGTQIENLTVEGSDGVVATGNDLNNVMTGGIGNDTLIGAGGNDTLDGGAGADIMTGGLGDDTYYVDNIGDVVHEDVAGGTDTVVSSVDWVMSDGSNVETVRLTGTAHSLTGNALDNHIAGSSGDDVLDGGSGDDTELGGDGDDRLISGSGSDILAGGSGDDRYEIHGGTTKIEDFLGHDTLDASQALGDSVLDLSGETQSEVEGHNCDFGAGGSTVLPLDVQFLQDLSGSFGDDIATVRGVVPSIVSALQAVQPNSMFGSSSFVDKPISPFGAAGEWVYRTELSLTNNITALTNTYNNMIIRYGADEPEAQAESLMQLALHATDVGFRPDSARFVVLFTDAPFHIAGDGAAAGITTPNNGDAVMNGNGIGEDYPAVMQLKAALVAANIIPIFAIANGYEANYQSLVNDLGRGTVVSLTSNSSNVVAAVTAGLTAATVTQIEDAVGGIGNDMLTGNAVANELVGNDGNDTLDGRGGVDHILAGAGNDRVAYDANDTNVDGGAGTDTLIVSTGGTFNLSLAADQSVGDAAVVTGFDAIDASTSTADVSLTGNGGGNNLAGGSGNDTLYGLAGNDKLTGNAGNDYLDGGIGADKLYGGDGNDTFVYDATDLLVSGSTGNDTLIVSTGGVFDLSAADQSLGDTAVVTGINYVDASTSSAAISITGADTTNVLTGGLGNDSLFGLGGNDKLTGGEGNDFIDGGIGADKLYGNNGNDSIVYDAADYSESGSAGFDTLIVKTGGTFDLSAADQSVGDTAVVTGFDAVDASVSTVSVQLTGSSSSNTLIGGSGADVINGMGSNDTIDGGAGADSLYGDIGNDRLVYDASDVVIDGGANTDTLAVSTGGNFDLSSATDQSIGDVAVVTGLENIDGGASVAVLQLNGSASSNTLTGGLGDDTINGQGGSDIINGGLGADIISGGSGNDRIFAAIGNDIISGGSGADSFVFTARGAGIATVTDFTLGSSGDHLDFTALLSSHPTTMSGYLHATDTVAGTVLAVDETGSGAFTDIAVLSNIHGQSAQSLFDSGNLWA